MIADSVAGGGDSLNVILNADRDSTGGGSIQLTGATIRSQGGAIVLGGGNGNPAVNGFATGTGLLTNGVGLTASTLDSAGGALVVRGTHTGLGLASGVAISASTLNSGAGNLDLIGAGTGLSVLLSSVNSTTGILSLTGSGLLGGIGLDLGGLGSTVSTTLGAINLNVVGDFVVDGALDAAGRLLRIDLTGGTVTQSASLQAAQLLLTGSGSFNLTNTANQIGTLAAAVTGDLSVNSAGSLTVGSLTSGTTVSGISSTLGKVKLVASGATSDLTLLNGIAAAGSGTTVELVAGRRFLNTANAAIDAGAGRFLVWSQTPVDDVRGTLAYGFKQYNAIAGSTVPAESGTNGFLYRVAPTLSAGLTGSVNKVYDGTTTATLTGSNYVFSGLLDGDIAVPLGSAALTTFDTQNVGSLKSITAVGVNLPTVRDGAANVYGYDLLSATITGAIGNITAATLSASLTGHAQKVYDGNTHADIQAGAVVTLNGIIGSDLVSAAVPLTGVYDTKNVGTNKNVTLLGLTLQGAAAGNYVLASANVTAAIGDITPATLTPTLTGSASKVYDATTAATLDAGNFQLAGAVAGDTVMLDSPANGLYDTKNVGTGKLVTAAGLTLSGLDAGNYVLSSTSVSGAIGLITPASLTAGLSGAVVKTYDGTTAATLNAGNLTVAGVLAGDSVTVAGGTAQFNTKDVGTNKLITATSLTLGGADAGNYTLASGSASAAIGQINAATISASLTGTISKVYDTNTVAALGSNNVILSGVIGGDVVAISTPSLGVYDTKDVGTNKVVTITGLDLSGADAGNYALSSTSASAAIGVITPATITAGLTGSVSKVYDGTVAATLASGNYQLSGLLAGDVVSLNNPVNGSYDTKNAGINKLVTVGGLALTGADAANYLLASATASAAVGTITAASLNVTVTGGLAGTIAKVYDGNTNATVGAGNLTLSGLVDGDAVTLSSAGGATFDTKNVGTNKTVTITGLGISGLDAANYTLSSTIADGAVGVITPATVAASLAGNVIKVYDGTPVATLSGSNYHLGGVLGSDLVTLNSPATGSYDTPNVGFLKTVTVGGLALAGADAGNYVLASNSASAAIGNITPLGLNVGLNASLSGTVSKTYDTTTVATLASTNFTLGGVVGTDLVSLSFPLTGTYDTKDVGINKVVTVTGLTLAGAAAGNYFLTSTSASGAVGVITPATVAASLSGSVNKVYDATTSAHLSAADYAINGVLGGEAVTLNAALTGTYDDKNVGTNKLVTVNGLGLTGAGAGNYVLASTSVSAAIGAISPASLSAGLTGSVVKVYDGNTAATLTSGNYTLSGVLNSDSVSINHPGLGSFDTKNVGTAKLITVVGLALSGSDAANYVLVSDSASAAIGAITPASLSVTLNGGLGGVIAKTYDTTTIAAVNAGSLTLSGLVGGDVVDLTSPGVGTYDTKNVGTNKLVTISGLTLTGADAGNYLLPSGSVSAAIGVITPAVLDAGLTGSATKVYDGTTTAHLSAGNYILSGVLTGDTVVLGQPASALYDTKDVGTNKLVSATGLTLGGSDGANYVLASNSISAAIGAITPATISVALNASLGGQVAKTYDGNTTATVAAGNVTLNGLVGSDAVSLGNTFTGVYDNKNAGTNKLVTVTGLELTGADAGNYLLASTNISGAVGVITPATLSASLSGTVTKTYDATTDAALGGHLQFTGVLGADTVTVGAGSATFDTKNVGTGKLVTAVGLTLGGLDAGNYILSSTSVGNAIGIITPATLSLGPGGVSKVYDGTTAAPGLGGFHLTGIRAGDLVQVVNAAGQYLDPNVLANSGHGLFTLTAFQIGGADAANYTFDSSVVGTAQAVGAITRHGLTVVIHDQTKQYGQTFTFDGDEFHAIGLQNGETLGTLRIVSPGTWSGALPNWDGYAIWMTQATGGTFEPSNYSIAAVNGRLRVFDSRPKVLVTARPAEHRERDEAEARVQRASTAEALRVRSPLTERAFTPAYSLEAGLRHDLPRSWRTWLPESSPLFTPHKEFGLDVDQPAYTKALKAWGWPSRSLDLADWNASSHFTISL